MTKSKERENIRNSSKKLIILCTLLLVIVIGVTYAWLSITIWGKDTNTIVAGTLSLNLNEHEYIDISGEKAVPLTKATAIAQTNNLYSFDLKNDGNIDSEYTIYLEIEDEDGETSIPNNLIRYIFTKNNIPRTDQLLSEAPKEEQEGEDKGKIILDSSNFDSNSKVLEPNRTNIYSLRLWIDESATKEIAGYTFRAKIKVVATQIRLD